MKKLTLIFFVLIFSISLLQAGTIANVIGHKDLLLTIDRGAMDGVESGMKGIVMAVYKDPSGEYTINIGIFTVNKMFARTAEVLNKIGKGFNPDDARYVVFDQDLIPNEAQTEPRTESPAPVKLSENVDQYLEQGDREAEAGNAKAALENYQKALALAPGSLVAKEKCNEMQNQINTAERKEKFMDNLKKADKIHQNEKGFWEAVFLKNITMIYIPEGEFTIGSPAREGDADEHPAHKIFLSGYWIGKTEVTFAQFDAFCLETGLEKPEDEGWGRGERPVIYVSWEEAENFCAWLKKKTGFAFRLPTEAEWEKAARDRFPWGNAPPDNQLANFNKDLMKTRPVGSYPQGSSPYGILDMAGNVWEWLADWYDADYYKNSADNDPQGPEGGSERAVRGGSWADSAKLIRSANRSQENPNSKLNILGFRLALTGH